MKDGRSAIWGGATIGLIIGIVIGLVTGNFWVKVLYSVLIGAGLGVVANILGWISDRLRDRQN